MQIVAIVHERVRDRRARWTTMFITGTIATIIWICCMLNLFKLLTIVSVEILRRSLSCCSSWASSAVRPRRQWPPCLRLTSVCRVVRSQVRFNWSLNGRNCRVHLPRNHYRNMQTRRCIFEIWKFGKASLNVLLQAPDSRIHTAGKISWKLSRQATAENKMLEREHKYLLAEVTSKLKCCRRRWY